jgi:predicted membrane-bound dolichyl-phosphate-mannose-protein mannosyltransferase
VAEKHFRLISAILLAVMAAAQFASIVQESQTWDEAIHILSGYQYVKRGDLRLNPEHPPFGKMLNALPLLAFNLNIPDDPQAWKMNDQVALGTEFLYSNRFPADTILLRARSMTILVTLLFGVALAAWTRRRFGAPAALAALFFFAFDPNIIAHSRYVTTDMVATVFIFLACVLWAEFLEETRTRYLILAGIALGLALVSKFSAAILLPIFLLLSLIRRWHAPAILSGRHLVRSFLIVIALAAAVILIVYAPDPFSRGRIHFSDHRWVQGLKLVWGHNRLGHESYLLGQISKKGWWYYFPVAFAVKTPVATLAAFGLAICLALLAFRRRRLGRLSFRWFAITVPPLAFFATAMAGHIDLGLRHILPVYPFLFVFIAGVLLKKANTIAVVAVACLLLVESIWIYPDYLAFFNFASGGPGSGPRYLVDSNIDWGQDMKKLKCYMDAHHLTFFCTAYFGTADFTYYGIGQQHLPTAWETEERRNADCIAAASVTPLYGLYVPGDPYRWLRERRPIAKIGYSIYLYDLRKKRRLIPAPTE